MTAQGFAEIVARVSFGGGLLFWLPSVEVTPTEDGGVRVRTRKLVLDRSMLAMSTDPASVRFRDGGVIGGDYFVSAAQLERATETSARERILFFVRDSMIHEIDEGIRFDGIIVRDPHASGEPRAAPSKTDPAR